MFLKIRNDYIKAAKIKAQTLLMIIMVLIILAIIAAVIFAVYFPRQYAWQTIIMALSPFIFFIGLTCFFKIPLFKRFLEAKVILEEREIVYFIRVLKKNNINTVEQLNEARNYFKYKLSKISTISVFLSVLAMVVSIGPILVVNDPTAILVIIILLGGLVAFAIVILRMSSLEKDFRTVSLYAKFIDFIYEIIIHDLLDDEKLEQYKKEHEEECESSLESEDKQE